MWCQVEYEADRLPKTAAIVLRHRLNGPEQVMQMAHERAPQGIAQGYKRVAGFDQPNLKAAPAAAGAR